MASSKRVIDLPDEVLVGLLSHLNLSDLGHMSATCRTLHRLATDDHLLWRARCRDHFGDQASEQRDNVDTWKQQYAVLKKHREQGCELFNRNSAEGMDYLIEHHVVASDAQAVADFLHSTPILGKKSIGWILGRRANECSKEAEANLDDIDAPEPDFYSRVARLYMSKIELGDRPVDEALRQLLLCIKLPGSSQHIRRILKDFAMVYYKQNRDEAERIFLKPEGPYIAAFSILMLNTDLHNTAVSRKMKKNEFVEHSAAMVTSLPREYIEGMYDRIKAEPLKIAPEGEDTPRAPADGARGRSMFSRFFR